MIKPLDVYNSPENCFDVDEETELLQAIEFHRNNVDDMTKRLLDNEKAWRKGIDDKTSHLQKMRLKKKSKEDRGLEQERK
jgi:hypothetical protein